MEVTSHEFHQWFKMEQKEICNGWSQRIASYERLKLPPFAVTEIETLSKSTVSLENYLLLSLPSKEKLAV